MENEPGPLFYDVHVNALSPQHKIGKDCELLAQDGVGKMNLAPYFLTWPLILSTTINPHLPLGNATNLVNREWWSL
jgi:hypothetical protein